MILIAGLGNPGTKYLKTLHNVGFMAVELLAEKNGAEFDKKGFKGLFGTKTIGGEKVVFLKPQTFMNLSGESIREIAAYFKIPSENILVIYDDIDIDIGALRIRKSGAAGTHNGMRNIVGELGTEKDRNKTAGRIRYFVLRFVGYKTRGRAEIPFFDKRSRSGCKRVYSRQKIRRYNVRPQR